MLVPVLRLLPALAIVCLCAPAQGQGDPAPIPLRRPDASGRVVSVFTFDEAPTSPQTLPKFWSPAAHDPAAGMDRPGFPVINVPAFDTAIAIGPGSVRLPTEGGSCALVLGSGVIPVFLDTDYRVGARVRTGGLIHARAGLLSRFLDQSGTPIPGSERRSEMILSEGEFKPVFADLIGAASNAAYIQIELLLLQPRELRHGNAKPFEVWRQDFSGAAWFDDVTVVQLPRIEIATPSIANIVALPDKPKLNTLVRDLTGESLTGVLEVRDVTGAVVARQEGPIPPGRAESVWTPELPGLGWFRASLQVRSAGTPVGSAYVDFVWISALPGGEDAPRIDKQRFAIYLDGLTDPAIAHLPHLASLSGSGAVTIPVWDRSLTAETHRQRLQSLLPAVDRLLADWQEVTFALPVVPAELSSAAGTDDPWILLSERSAAANAFLDPLLDRYGQVVRRWQIGALGDDRLFWRADLANELTAMEAAVSRLVPGPVFVLPWRADLAFDSARISGRTGSVAMAALYPGDLPALGLRSYGEAFAASAGVGAAELTVVLGLPAAAEVGLRARCVELARRTVEFWSGFDHAKLPPGTPPARVAVFEPFAVVGARRPQVMPAPELAVWRNLTELLAGRHFVQELDAAPGIRCVLFGSSSANPTRGGLIVAWNEASEPEHAVLTRPLGAGPVELIDMFGNRRPAPLAGGADAGGNGFEIPIPTEPLFIEGVDSELIRFLSGARLEPALVESSTELQEHAIVLINPWPQPIEGRLTIVSPGVDPDRERAWEIRPRTMSFNLAPGQTARLPLSLIPSRAERAGRHELVMDIELNADRTYGAMRVRSSLEVGLPYLRVELLARPGSTEEDIVVEAQTTNIGPEPLDLELTVFAPGQPRHKASVTQLNPGDHTVRRFVFPGLASALRGQRIILSVSVPDRHARIVREATVP